MVHTPQAILEYEILGEDKKIVTMPTFKAEVEMKVKDKKGNIKFSKKQPFRSFVGNFADILNYIFTAQTGGSILKTAGTSATQTTFSMDTTEAAKSGVASNYGIWIGNVTNNSGISGLTANSDMGSSILHSDYAMNTKISPTNSVDFGLTTVTVSNGVLSVNRTFTNSYGSAIKISEIGLVAETNNSEYVLIARDRFNDGTNNYVEVADDYIIDISYNFNVTSSSGWVDNFIGFLSSQFNGGNTVQSVRDTLGAYYTENFQGARTNADVMAASAENNYGLLVGGYDAILTRNDRTPSLSKTAYKLDSKLTNSDLTHGAVVALNTAGKTVSGNYCLFGIQRDFTNASSTDTQYVYEAGFVLKHASSSRYYMISRLLTPGSGVSYIAVAPGKILRMKYYLALPIDAIESAE